MGVLTCPIEQRYMRQQVMTGQFYERSLVELHAGVWATRSRQAHTINKSRRAQVSDAVGDSSQVEEWNDDEPLF